jgi:hypothetical protein
MDQEEKRKLTEVLLSAVSFGWLLPAVCCLLPAIYQLCLSLPAFYVSVCCLNRHGPERETQAD